MRACLLACWVLSLLTPLSGAQPVPQEASASIASAHDRVEQFHEHVERLAATDDFVGLAYAIVGPAEPPHIGARIRTLGVRKTGSAEPIGPDTRFRIASLSKGFAGTLAAELIREKRLSLTTPLSDFRPDFHLRTVGAVNIPIADILTHRLGLPPNAYDNLLEDGISVPRIEKRLARVKPICSPGSCYAYQNVAFDLIVDVIEQIEGLAYGEILHKRLFKPLGMAHASLGRSALQADNDWARPHRRRRGEPWRIIDVQPNYYRLPAAAGINASINDMAKWLQAQMGQVPDVLPAETLRLIHAPRTPTLSETRRKSRRMPDLSETAYGLGWRVYNYAGETVITHSGAVAGYAASIAFIPERQIGIVLLSNTNTRSFHQLIPLFLDLQLGRPVTPS